MWRLSFAQCSGTVYLAADGDDESDRDHHVKDRGVARIAVGIEKVRDDARAQNDGGYLRVRRGFAEPQGESDEQRIESEAAVNEQQVDALHKLCDVHLQRDVENRFSWCGDTS